MDGPWRGRGLRIGDDHQGLRGWAFSPFGKGPYSKPVLGVGSCKGNEPFIKIKPSSSGLSGLCGLVKAHAVNLHLCGVGSMKLRIYQLA